jgi:HTH-type transcriptional regulator / antitoxin MqsA
MIFDRCGQTRCSEGQISKPFVLDGRIVLVQNIPAVICDACGEANFSAKVAERLRRMIHEPHKPVRVVSAEILAFDAA